LHGVRWNPRGVFRAVYGSLTPETAMGESLAHSRYSGLPPANDLPRVFVAISVRLQRVLDLTPGDARRALRVARERMLTEDWRRARDRGDEALTQAIGRAAFEVGMEGLLVPSAQPEGGVNLVVFPENLQPGSSLSVQQSARLRSTRP
jgi:RES domain-containing protein